MAVGDGSNLAFIDVGAGKLVRGSLMNQSSGSLNIAWWCKSMCNVHVKCLQGCVYIIRADHDPVG